MSTRYAQVQQPPQGKPTSKAAAGRKGTTTKDGPRAADVRPSGTMLPALRYTLGAPPVSNDPAYADIDKLHNQVFLQDKKKYAKREQELEILLGTRGLAKAEADLDKTIAASYLSRFQEVRDENANLMKAYDQDINKLKEEASHLNARILVMEQELHLCILSRDKAEGQVKVAQAGMQQARTEMIKTVGLLERQAAELNIALLVEKNKVAALQSDYDELSAKHAKQLDHDARMEAVNKQYCDGLTADMVRSVGEISDLHTQVEALNNHLDLKGRIISQLKTQVLAESGQRLQECEALKTTVADLEKRLSEASASSLTFQSKLQNAMVVTASGSVQTLASSAPAPMALIKPAALLAQPSIVLSEESSSEDLFRDNERLRAALLACVETAGKYREKFLRMKEKEILASMEKRAEEEGKTLEQLEKKRQKKEKKEADEFAAWVQSIQDTVTAVEDPKRGVSKEILAKAMAGEDVSQLLAEERARRKAEKKGLLGVVQAPASEQVEVAEEKNEKKEKKNEVQVEEKKVKERKPSVDLSAAAPPLPRQHSVSSQGVSNNGKRIHSLSDIHGDPDASYGMEDEQPTPVEVRSRKMSGDMPQREKDILEERELLVSPVSTSMLTVTLQFSFPDFCINRNIFKFNSNPMSTLCALYEQGDDKYLLLNQTESRLANPLVSVDHVVGDGNTEPLVFDSRIAVTYPLTGPGKDFKVCIYEVNALGEIQVEHAIGSASFSSKQLSLPSGELTLDLLLLGKYAKPKGDGDEKEEGDRKNPVVTIRSALFQQEANMAVPQPSSSSSSSNVLPWHQPDSNTASKTSNKKTGEKKSSKSRSKDRTGPSTSEKVSSIVAEWMHEVGTTSLLSIEPAFVPSFLDGKAEERAAEEGAGKEGKHVGFFDMMDMTAEEVAAEKVMAAGPVLKRWFYQVYRFRVKKPTSSSSSSGGEEQGNGGGDAKDGSSNGQEADPLYARLMAVKASQEQEQQALAEKTGCLAHSLQSRGALIEYSGDVYELYDVSSPSSLATIPVFPPLLVNPQSLCNLDFKRPILFRLFSLAYEGDAGFPMRPSPTEAELADEDAKAKKKRLKKAAILQEKCVLEGEICLSVMQILRAQIKATLVPLSLPGPKALESRPSQFGMRFKRTQLVMPTDLGSILQLASSSSSSSSNNAASTASTSPTSGTGEFPAGMVVTFRPTVTVKKEVAATLAGITNPGDLHMYVEVLRSLPLAGASRPSTSTSRRSLGGGIAWELIGCTEVVSGVDVASFEPLLISYENVCGANSQTTSLLFRCWQQSHHSKSPFRNNLSLSSSSSSSSSSLSVPILLGEVQTTFKALVRKIQKADDSNTTNKAGSATENTTADYKSGLKLAMATSGGAEMKEEEGAESGQISGKTCNLYISKFCLYARNK